MPEKIKRFLGRKEIRVLLPILIGGILLLVLAGRGTDTAKTDESSPLDAQREAAEEELAALCREVDGVGKCRVMITFEGGAKRSYSGGKLVYEEPPKVSGVSVVCTGGDRVQVRAALTEMIAALYGIGANRISILPSG